MKSGLMHLTGKVVESPNVTFKLTLLKMLFADPKKAVVKNICKRNGTQTSPLPACLSSSKLDYAITWRAQVVQFTSMLYENTPP